ncbi:acyl-CoA synthetase [Rhodococcus rhodochrous]|uniref:AMP-dependent synthetase n=1 Tax=Rhodococcus rhodochrous KG-21 TaxID=1441923 RepID=A0A0M8PJN2_RHORH|nr:long-chain fatty acid--CoA ligase [Rhodococcus rhodochrous]KOS57656.1 AMP-dependent synthetase [Rhodococcus rhodochrous KG-21]
MNLGIYLSRSSTYWPEHEAVVCGDQRWTYRRLEDSTNRLASALIGRGLEPAHAVATFAGNRPQLVETEMALCKAGLLRVPINARLGAAEVAHVLRDAAVRMLFVDAEHVETALKIVADAGTGCTVVDYDDSCDDAVRYSDLLAEGDERPVAIEVDPEVPAVLNFTSGSTGKLKAAVQTHGNRLANMRKRLMTPDSSLGVGERYLAPGPITHASGMGLLASLSRGSTVVILPHWDTALFLRTLESERITSTFMVPTMLNLVLDHPEATTTDYSSLRCVRIGGAPVSPQRLRDAVDLFGPVVAQGYGQAETTSGITVLTPDDVQRGIGSDPELLLSCGRAVFDTEVRVVDDEGRPVPAGELGEIVVRGPDCVHEYWHEPELSAETFRDGWVHTGDIGRLRDDGYLFIVDRKKDMIISGGFNIYCSEVEAALYEHPDVSEVCVVGVPDERWGEAVKAVVVPRPGIEPTEAALIDHCAQRLAGMKKPRSVDFVESLPINRNGKVDRRAVRDAYWSGAERHVH